MTLLHGKLVLFDVADTEAFCAKILASSKASTLPEHEQEDALSFLISEAWILAQSYDATRGPSFSTFAYRRLRLKLVDHARAKHRTKWKFGDGRVYERERPQILNLNGNAAERSELGGALSSSKGDPATNRDPSLTRVLGCRGFGDARDIDELRD
jgi:hypothetical protein